jgi:hypothetical protein
MSETPSVAAAPPADAAQADGGAQKIDVQKLADKVYDLLLTDARLGRARSDSPLVERRQGEG